MTESSHKLRRHTQWIILGMLFIVGCKTTAGTQWQHLAPGLDYTALDLEAGKLHAFKIDLKENHLALLSPSQPSSVKEMGINAGALLTVNAGFFTPEGKPLGLRINNGEQLFPLKPISWWGVFYVSKTTPKLSSFNNFNLSNDIEFAIQAGPRLLVDKIIPHLKENVDNRTAIGYNQNNEVIIVVSEGAALTTVQLANILRRPEKNGGLGCVYALNLDGGSSTQIYTQVGDFVLDIPSFRAVADGIAVLSRS